MDKRMDLGEWKWVDLRKKKNRDESEVFGIN